jgi:hypothetical protein
MDTGNNNQLKIRSVSSSFMENESDTSDPICDENGNINIVSLCDFFHK